MLTTFLVSKRKTISPAAKLASPLWTVQLYEYEGKGVMYVYVHFTLKIYRIVHCVLF
jgi:hypothetical protein